MASGEAVAQRGVAVHYRIERAGKIFPVDDDPAGRALLQGEVLVSFDPTRLRLWPASPQMMQLLEERT